MTKKVNIRRGAGGGLVGRGGRSWGVAGGDEASAAKGAGLRVRIEQGGARGCGRPGTGLGAGRVEGQGR